MPVLGAGGLKDKPCGVQTVALGDEEGGRCRTECPGERAWIIRGLRVFRGGGVVGWDPGSSDR